MLVPPALLGSAAKSGGLWYFDWMLLSGVAPSDVKVVFSALPLILIMH